MTGKQLNNELLNNDHHLQQETVDHFFNFLNTHPEGTFLHRRTKQLQFGKNFESYFSCLRRGQTRKLENVVKNNPVVNFLVGQYVANLYH
jgi:hypothetical protein